MQKYSVTTDTCSDVAGRLHAGAHSEPEEGPVAYTLASLLRTRGQKGRGGA